MYISNTPAFIDEALKLLPEPLLKIFKANVVVLVLAHPLRDPVMVIPLAFINVDGLVAVAPVAMGNVIVKSPANVFLV
jgi:hypothetical protein